MLRKALAAAAFAAILLCVGVFDSTPADAQGYGRYRGGAGVGVYRGPRGGVAGGARYGGAGVGIYRGPRGGVAVRAGYGGGYRTGYYGGRGYGGRHRTRYYRGRGFWGAFRTASYGGGG